MAEWGGLAWHLDAVQQRCAAIASGEAGAEHRAALIAETHTLAEWLDRARRELSNFETGEIVDFHIPAATEELKAVVSHTEAATTAILCECEALEDVVAGTPCHEAVAVATARIYEACSFQDITGQRMAKVVQTLQLVERRLAEMIHLVGPIPAAHAAPPGPPPLLNGPQQSQDAMDQSAVDALLASCE